MKIIKPKVEVILCPVTGNDALKIIEGIGRTCYKSEERMTGDSAEKFVRRIIDSGHHSVIEHLNYTARITCDRGVSHEIVRHRIASYSQESTRYCNYSKGKFGGEITCIDITEGIELCPKTGKLSEQVKGDIIAVWWLAMEAAEASYMKMIELGASPQIARSVLPNSLKTEIVVTMNLREWRHFFKLRSAKAAHPQMREVVIPLLKWFKKLIPVIFDDIEVEK